MCVQSSSVLRVLQFTPFNVVCYVLHRSVSQVIHGQQLSFLEAIASVKSMAVSGVEDASRLDYRPFQLPLHSSSVRLIAHYKYWQADSPTEPEVDRTVSTTPKL